MIDFGRGVYLGPLDSKYCDQIRNWRNDFEIYSWCRQFDLITDFDQNAWFTRQSQDSSTLMYAIMKQGEMVGVCGLTSLDRQNRRAEFSIYIGPEHQKKNYGKAALQTLLDHGFSNLGLNTIWGETFEGNHAASFFETLGFVNEGRRRDFYFKKGKFIDALLYSIRSTEWKSGVSRGTPERETKPIYDDAVTFRTGHVCGESCTAKTAW